MSILFTKIQWFRFPPKLKRRWWEETDYNKKEPSDELRRLVYVELRKQEDEDE